MTYDFDFRASTRIEDGLTVEEAIQVAKRDEALAEQPQSFRDAFVVQQDKLEKAWQNRGTHPMSEAEIEARIEMGQGV